MFTLYTQDSKQINSQAVTYAECQRNYYIAQSMMQHATSDEEYIRAEQLSRTWNARWRAVYQAEHLMGKLERFAIWQRSASTQENKEHYSNLVEQTRQEILQLLASSHQTTENK